MKSHFLSNCHQVEKIIVRKIACLNCNGCSKYKYVWLSGEDLGSAVLQGHTAVQLEVDIA